MSRPIPIPGTTLEGGGQLVRISVGISALTSTAIRITDIRGKRSGGGGLKPQHLTCVNWLASVSSANISGAEVKSKILDFCPGLERKWQNLGHAFPIKESRLTDGIRTVEIKITQNTPGSIGLVFQAILPFLLFQGHSLLTTARSGADNPQPTMLGISITGGTNVPWSPSYDYISHVLIPTLSTVGLAPIRMRLQRRGWSTGLTEVGEVWFGITPLSAGSTLPSYNLTDRGDVESVYAKFLVPTSMSRNLEKTLTVALAKRLPTLFSDNKVPVSVDIEDSRHPKRFYLLLVATTSNGYKLGRDWLYDRRIGAEWDALAKALSQLIKRLVEELAVEIECGGCVDEYMQDQLIIFQALAEGRSSMYCGVEKDGKPRALSLHTQTAQWVTETLLGVNYDDGGGCKGVGLVAGERYQERNMEPMGEEIAKINSLELSDT